VTKQSHRERAKSARPVWIGLLARGFVQLEQAAVAALLAPAFAGAAALLALAFTAGAAGQEWPSYGGDPGGQRFSSAIQITPQNVGRLTSAWIFHTGEQQPPGPKGASFEDTPILADGKLLVCTTTDRVFALDPLTGHAIWAFDPKLAAGLKPASDFLCRGAAVWRDTAASPGADCRTRVVLATLDLRVMELDLATGRPCDGFGERGTVQVAPARPPRYPGAMAFDSPPRAWATRSSSARHLTI
jgi:quinoprotein glucose dehydrogenase